MNAHINNLIIFLIITSNLVYSQEIKNGHEKKNNAKNIPINSIENGADQLIVKDSDDNVLMKVEDKGFVGEETVSSTRTDSIYLSNQTYKPGITTDKLYNHLGELYWSGSIISGGEGVKEINDLTDAIYDGSSLFLGATAGIDDDGSDNLNIALGRSALRHNTTGYSNIALGPRALYYNEVGYYNIGIGREALENNHNGNYNIGIGYGTLSDIGNGIGSQNVAIGYLADYWSGGDNNVSIGHKAGGQCTGNNNTFVGCESGKPSNPFICLTNCVTLGYQAGYNSIGSNNVFIGPKAAYSVEGNNLLYIENTDSDSPLIWGDFSTDNVKINGELEITIKTKTPQIQITNGAVDGYVLTSDAAGNASWLSGSGGGAEQINELNDAKYDGSSLFLGEGAGENDNGSNNWNTSVGRDALFLNTIGSNNTAIGFYALRNNTTGELNTANGTQALYSNISGMENTSYGKDALYANTTGNSNTANGTFSLSSNIEGDNNTAVGYGALNSNTIGNYNVALGDFANKNNQEGSRNTILGSQAGNGESTHNKSGNVFIGYKAGYYETSNSKLYIENTDTDSPLIWGDFDTNRVVINGNGTNGHPGYEFFVNGDAGGNSSWNSLSDKRLKKNISTIENALEKVKKLRGVNFEWTDTKNQEKGLQMGFIAQEAKEVIPEVVDGSGEYFSMQYAPITALLVEAVKEQEIRFKTQESRIEELEQENKKLAEEVKVIRNAFVKNESLLKQVINELYDKKIEIKVVSTVK